ncbi:MAG: hypothetical protein FD123_191 [Bacteroidetes bacterium]|nr:MAG: hypothetical protein FD123_191 [Bacteroidota bacterium]
MIDQKEFALNFNGLEVPAALVKLLDFENAQGNAYYSAGFELGCFDKVGLRSYSENELFLDSIIEFARADGTGSTYGFWLRNNTRDLREAPVIVSGGEGGMHIVAENIQGLLHILAYDAEPMVSWKKVYYYKNETDHEASPKADAYKKWMSDYFNAEPAADADSIVKSAQEKYEYEFQHWLKGYYAG